MDSMESRQAVWTILFDNAVASLAKQPNSMNICKLLCMAANHRYNIERILCKWFGNPNVNDSVIEQFGRCRNGYGIWGRINIDIDVDLSEEYWPYNWFERDDYKVWHTPIYIKYGAYKNSLKMMSEVDTCIEPSVHPIHRLLYKINPSVRTIRWKDVELSTLYYEQSDILIGQLEAVPIKDRKMANDIGQYRAIYHTPIGSHKAIMKYIEKNKFVIHSGDYNKKIEYIKNVYWLLSHAMLYERGSASITEMVCNVLWRWIGNTTMLTNKANHMADVEAILCSNTDVWNVIFDNVLTTRQPMCTTSKPIDIQMWLKSKYIGRNPKCIKDIENKLMLVGDASMEIVSEDGYTWRI